VGRSGGLLVAWDHVLFALKPFLCCGDILLTGTCCANKQHVNLLNVYGPCTDRLAFWTKVLSIDLLEKQNLIVPGNFNFTLSANEIWGDIALSDPTTLQLKYIFLHNNLVDLLPTTVVPTWRNNMTSS